MTIIKAAELGKKVLDDYNAAMDEQDKIKQGVTVIDVVARHEKEIQELKRLVTPMMEFKRREWVGLTDEELINMSCGDLHFAALLGEVVRKLKEKNI